MTETPRPPVLRFRKKPVVIDAIRFDGRNIEDVVAFATENGPLPHAPDDPHVHAGIGYTPATGQAFIPTLEGTMTANPGDWIIRGVVGEIYPCKQDIFAVTYEPVGPPRSDKGTKSIRGSAMTETPRPPVQGSRIRP